jgi:hypothetical protein
MENLMTRFHALCLSVSLAFGASHAVADDITIDPNPFVSTATRAQVQQEMRAFRQAGVNPWSDSYDALAQFRSTTTRAEVMAQFHASRNEVAALTGEDSGSIYLARANGRGSDRATVLARSE